MQRLESAETIKAAPNVEIEENEESYEAEDGFAQDINILLNHGILPEDVKAIKLCGINTLKGLDMTTNKEMLTIKNLTLEKIDKIRNICAQYLSDDPFISASKFYENRKQIFKISTGSLNLNTLLGGGIEAQSITEIFGEHSTGKTQLSHTLCVTAQMPGLNDYMGGKVIFIDTEGTFRPERLCEIGDRFNLDKETVLSNVLYTRANNSEHQFLLLNKVAQKLHESPGLFKLLIVDSIMALFRVDFLGQKDILNRQQQLGRMMSRLRKLSEEYNIAIFITNHVMDDIKNNLTNQTKPTGGHVIAHSSTTRILFSTISCNHKLAKLCDSPHLQNNEVLFSITTGGITDPID